MRTSQTADLESALRAWLASVDGDGPSAAGDKFNPTSPFTAARDQAGEALQSPGARAAAAVNAQKSPQVPSPNSGQTATGRRATLPEPVQQAAAQADRLLELLQRIDGASLGHQTPGQSAAGRQGGTRAQRGQDLRQNYWGLKQVGT